MATTDESMLLRFYELLDRLGSLPGQGPLLGSCSGGGWPRRGVYFFFEAGELRRTGSERRVVRVGTHALNAGSRSTLWGRLRSHRGTATGSGNHRGSIFRLHVGQSLLARSGAELESWGRKSSASREVRDNEGTHELAVSRYIGSMSIRWVSVPDDPGAASRRGIIERGAIALLSNRLGPIDPPSGDWLGLSSTRLEIRESGLWNVNHVNEAPDAAFLDVLEGAVCEMEGPNASSAAAVVAPGGGAP